MRLLFAVLTLAILASSAQAGLKCIKRPEYVFIAPGAALDELAHWRRSSGEEMATGTLSREAFARITAMSPEASSVQMIRCLDALIADEHGKAAKRACVKQKG